MGYYEEQGKCRATFISTIREIKEKKITKILIKPFRLQMVEKFYIGESFVDKLILNYSDFFNYKIKDGFIIFDYEAEEEAEKIKALKEVESLKKDLDIEED